MTTSAINDAAHSGGPREREGASRASRPTPSACLRWRKTRSQPYCRRGPTEEEEEEEEGGGERRSGWQRLPRLLLRRRLRIRRTRGRRSPAQAGLSTLVDVDLWVPSVPVVLPQPPPPCPGGGGRDRAAWGIVDAVTVAVAVARQIRIRQTRGRRSPAQAGLSTPVNVGLRVPTVPIVLPPPSSTPLGRRRVRSRRAGDCRCRRHRRRAAPSEEDSCTPPSSTARCPRRHSAHCDARSA